jgi:transposase
MIASIGFDSSITNICRSVVCRRNLIRIWVRKYEEGAFDDDARAADLIQEYEARIAALERFVGKQALELEFLKGPREPPWPVIGA